MRYGIMILILSLMTAAGAFAGTIYEEGFESGILPTDWSVWAEGSSSTIQWIFDTAYPHTGTYYMHHNYDPHNDLDNWVDTQTFDMTSVTNISLELWHGGAFPIDYGYTGIWVSTVASPGSTSDFVELVEIGAPPGGIQYEELIVDCSAYDNSAHLTFAFVYRGEGAHTVRIDDLLLTGDGGTGIKAASLGALKATFK